MPQPQGEMARGERGSRERRTGEGNGMPGMTSRVSATDPNIIAPCGLDCSLCRFYLRARRPCPGCRGSDRDKSTGCITCAIKTCAERSAGGFKYCSSCAGFPCPRLRHLDHRYRTRYGVSVMDNLARIQAIGVRRFIAEERSRWTCLECGVPLSMHLPQCVSCGHPRESEIR